MSRKGIVRIAVDFTEEQKGAFDQMIAEAEAQASQAAGVEIKISAREFIHRLLKQEAQARGVPWPENYPARGGWRGGRKKGG